MTVSLYLNYCSLRFPPPQAGATELEAPWPVAIFGLRKVYKGGKVAVKSLSFHINEDECFGLLGPNGAGKTTAISLLTGLLKPTAGTAHVVGHDLVTQMQKIHQRMGVCPQFDILWPQLTVYQTMLFYVRLKGVPSGAEMATATAAARRVGLDGAHLQKQVQHLSGGMKAI